MGVGGGYPPPPSKSRKKETMKRENILESLERERQERWVRSCQARARLIEDIDRRRKKENKEEIIFMLKITPLCAAIAYAIVRWVV